MFISDIVRRRSSTSSRSSIATSPPSSGVPIKLTRDDENAEDDIALKDPEQAAEVLAEMRQGEQSNLDRLEDDATLDEYGLLDERPQPPETKIEPSTEETANTETLRIQEAQAPQEDSGDEAAQLSRALEQPAVQQLILSNIEATNVQLQQAAQVVQHAVDSTERAVIDQFPELRCTPPRSMPTRSSKRLAPTSSIRPLRRPALPSESSTSVMASPPRRRTRASATTLRVSLGSRSRSWQAFSVAGLQ